VTGVEIRPVRTPILRISGKISGAPSGSQPAMVQIQRVGGGISSGSASKPDGSFELWRVDPGKYTLRAQYSSGGADLRSAPVQIEVAGSDIDNLSLTLIPSGDIQGQVLFETRKRAADHSLSSRSGSGRATGTPSTPAPKLRPAV